MECLWYFFTCWQFVSSLAVLLLTLRFSSCETWSNCHQKRQSCSLSIPCHAQPGYGKRLVNVGSRQELVQWARSTIRFNTRITFHRKSYLCGRWASCSDGAGQEDSRHCSPKGGREGAGLLFWWLPNYSTSAFMQHCALFSSSVWKCFLFPRFSCPLHYKALKGDRCSSVFSTQEQVFHFHRQLQTFFISQDFISPDRE